MTEGQPEKGLEDTEDTGTVEGGSQWLITSGNRNHPSSEPATVQLENRYKALASDKKEPTPMAGETKPRTPRGVGLIPLLLRGRDEC